MSGEIKVLKISPTVSTDITLGDSGDTFTVPSGVTLAVASGATLANSGTVTGIGGGFLGLVVYTADGTYTRGGTSNGTAGNQGSADVTKVIIHAIGGGGAGGGGYNSTFWGQAGGGGAYFIKSLVVSGITSSTITIGDAGPAVAQTTVGSNGGNTIWADGTNTLTANGGAGGDRGYNNGHGSGYGTGGTTSSGDVNFAGSRGTNGSAGGTIPGIPMGGWGFSPYDYATSGNRVSTGYGYGGWTANSSPWSYAGGGGLMIIEEYA